MSSLHYLTVQDMLWINLQVTKKVHRFNYARLEEATFYQYGYGQSTSLLEQASRFLTGFVKMHPIDAGNDATAFIGCLAFLKINGQEISLDDADASAWFARVQSKEVPAVQALRDVSRDSGHGHHDGVPDVRATVRGILDGYEQTIARLNAPVAV
jgi:prophage maintenance system killer protein